jgi:hypothetical protein
MSTNFVNRKASQSLRGQAVLVTLDGTDSANLDLLSEGQICLNNSSGVYGTINRVDYFGHSFSVNPIQPDRNFASSGTYGYLAVNEIVNVRTD